MTNSNIYFNNFFFKSPVQYQLYLSFDIVELERELMFLNRFSDITISRFFFLQKRDIRYLLRKEFYNWHFLVLRRINFKYLNYLFYYYLKLWGFTLYKNKKLQILKERNNYILPVCCYNINKRNFFRRSHLTFIRLHYFSFFKKNYSNNFILKYRKKLLKKTSFLSYWKHFNRFAFSQRFLMVFFFECRFLNRFFFFKNDKVRRCIKFFIVRYSLLTLKSLGFYKRTVISKRYKRRR